MRCIFCGNEINDYRLANFDIVTHPRHQPFSTVGAWDGGMYVGTAYVAALVECPHCDMVFFLRAASKQLKDMNLVVEDAEPPIMPPEDEAISKMTPEEKRALYEKMKKELIERYS